MNPSAIYSKSGKGVQEASGKTSLLKRGDRAVLSAIDGRATLGEVAHKVGKAFDAEFEKLITQLDKDGFVREVAAGAGASTSQSRPTIGPKAATRPAPTPPPVPSGGGEDLDFTTIMPAIKPGAAAKPAAPPPAPKPDPKAQDRAKAQEVTLYKAREEAEARAAAERERLRIELEAKTRAETEAKIRAETERKVREEAQAKLKAEAEAKAKAARDAALKIAAEAKAKAEAEAKAKIEAERKVREEAERKAREEAEKARREAEELRQKLEEERKAREAEERKRKDEEEQRRREEDERRAREEAERKAREEAERQRREEEERQRKAEEERRRREEEERREREEIEAKAREAAEQARRAEEDRRLREKEEQALRARQEEEDRERARQELERARAAAQETKVRQATVKAPAPPPPPPPAAPAAPSGGSLDALMADLDSFSQREEQERETRDAAERKVREEKKRKHKEESDRRAQELAAKEELERQRAAEEARRREDDERRAQEEAERRLREVEEQRRLEAEERQRRAREVLAAKPVVVAPQAAAASDDIPVTDDDLHMDDVRRDEAAVAKETRKAQREKEREARQREREARERAQAAAREEPMRYPKARRPIKWGRPVAILFFVLLVGAVVALHVVPLPMADYEDAASEALGRPVKIGSGRLSLFTGVRLNLQDVSVGGNVKIASVHAYPRIGSLIDDRKAFRRIELEGVTVPQEAIGETISARMRGNNFNVGRILVKNLRLPGPVPLPTFEADAVLAPDGTVSNVTLRGPDSLNAKLSPAPRGEVEFDVTASSVAVPFVPDLTLSSFAMRGIASRNGMNIASWGGSVLDGALSGTASVRWTNSWQVDGVLTVRGINAAVFAPALLSEGKAEGTGRFSMSGREPTKLADSARLEGNFIVGKGVLGSFDLSRVLQTGGRQHAGRTPFTEMTGQGLYDRGAVALRNISITAGALNAGASADISSGGALAGRIVADIRTSVQPLRATLILGGTVKEPQVRN